MSGVDVIAEIFGNATLVSIFGFGRAGECSGKFYAGLFGGVVHA